MKTLQELEAQLEQDTVALVLRVEGNEGHLIEVKKVISSLRMVCLADAYSLLIKAIKAGELKL